MIEIKEYKFGINCGLRFLAIAETFYGRKSLEDTITHILGLFPRKENDAKGNEIIIQNENIDFVKEVYNLLELSNKSYAEKTKTDAVFNKDMFYNICDEIGMMPAIEQLSTAFMNEFAKSVSYGLKTEQPKKKVETELV